MIGQHLLPLIHETLGEQCRSSAGLVILASGSQREREREATVREGCSGERRRMKSPKEVEENREEKKAKEFGRKVERRQVESTECEM